MREESQTNESKEMKDLSFMGMNLLLIGPSHVTQKLALALIQVDLSSPSCHHPTTTTTTATKTKTSMKNAAIEVLRKHYCSNSSSSSSSTTTTSLVIPKRCIHTVESLTTKNDDKKKKKDWGTLKMDHIVMVIPPSSSSLEHDNDDVEIGDGGGDSGIMTKTDLDIARELLIVNNDNYYMQRITMIEVMPSHDNFEQQQRQHVVSNRTNHDSSLGEQPLVTFLLYWEDPQSHSTVARMILQRARIGSRPQETLIPIHPRTLV